MRVISLVTEGLERTAQVGGLDWLFAQDADIICLQDTRCAEHTLRGDAFFPEHYHPYFLDHYDNPSLNGVAIYCKELPRPSSGDLVLMITTLRASTFRRTTPTSVLARCWCPPDREAQRQ